MNKIRQFNFNNHSSLEKQGLSLGDYLVLLPISGRKKRICLKRTAYVLASHDNSSSIKLPVLKDEVIECCLELISPLKELSKKETRARYLLRSNNGQPFKINGVLSFESFLEKGDEVILGSNVLKFEDKEAVLSSIIEVDHPILKNHKLIRSDLSILIQGETGTGKTRLARRIHDESGSSGDFVHINLSSFSPSLIESELFGHQKGSFTGAIKNKVGALASANFGTLFIDEIDSLPYALQTKLLLFLDDQKFSPVGSRQVLSANTRIIFASGRSLIDLVKRGSMREDFYFRIISGHEIRMRPLRDCPELIDRLINYFSIKNNVSLTIKLKEFYKTQPWPGNIRQLLGHLNKKLHLRKCRKIDFDDVDESLISMSCDLAKIDESYFLSMKELKRKYAQLVYFRLDQDLHKSSECLKITPKTMKVLIDNIIAG